MSGKFITGEIVTSSGSIRKVEMQNDKSSFWAYSPADSDKALYVSSDSAEPNDYQGWQLILTDRAAKTYEIKNVATGKFAYVPEGTGAKKGVEVTLSATIRLWTIIQVTGVPGYYKVSPKGDKSLFWTVPSTSLDAHITLDDTSADSTTWKFRNAEDQ